VSKFFVPVASNKHAQHQPVTFASKAGRLVGRVMKVRRVSVSRDLEADFTTIATGHTSQHEPTKVSSTYWLIVSCPYATRRAVYDWIMIGVRYDQNEAITRYLMLTYFHKDSAHHELEFSSGLC